MASSKSSKNKKQQQQQPPHSISWDYDLQDDFDEEGNRILYIHGNSLTYGNTGSKSGFGVYWGVNHPNNISLPLAPGPQTVHRSTLMAAICAIEQSWNNWYGGVQIRTSNAYVVNIGNDLVKQSKKNLGGQSIKHLAELERLEKLLQREIHVVFKLSKRPEDDYGSYAASLFAENGGHMCYEMWK